MDEVKKSDLVKLDPSRATVQGSEFAIEDKVTGKVYITNKGYIDKLFKEMGYKNLGVIKILEEFAGKVVSDIGTLSKSSLFINEETDTFIVTPEDSVKWVEDMFSRFRGEGFKILRSKKSDDYKYWDEYLVLSSTGTYFVIYVDLLDEYVEVFSLDYSPEDELVSGMIDEGRYLFGEEDSLTSLMTLMTNPIDISSMFDPEQNLSMQEYADILVKTGYIKKKRKNYVLTEEGELSQSTLGGLEEFLDDLNIKSWIQRRINKAPNNFKFKDACRLVSRSISLGDLRFWDVKDLYHSNATETSDMFELNK